MRLIAVSPVLLSIACAPSGAAQDEWAVFDAEERALAVNEGELQFLSSRPDRPAHEHLNWIQVSGQSLSDGWVGLRQCHRHLDAVPAAEIHFAQERIRDLRITEANGIGAARVEGHIVILEDIARGAGLCLSAETRALHPVGSDRWELRNGPYMRRFLDGYYPMRVALHVHYPESLMLGDIEPTAQPGVTVDRQPGVVRLDLWFEGKLWTRIGFRRVTPR